MAERQAYFVAGSPQSPSTPQYVTWASPANELEQDEHEHEHEQQVSQGSRVSPWEKWKKHAERHPCDYFLKPIMLAVYILAGIFIYQRLETSNANNQSPPHFSDGWTLTDCTYFVAMSMSTVGYGDIAPTPDKSGQSSRVFTIFVVCFHT